MATWISKGKFDVKIIPPLQNSGVGGLTGESTKRLRKLE
jgi:hypothetical protein